jgi:hypothetical protein
MHRLLVIGLVVWLMSSSTALAQDAPELIVTLKDINNVPLVGATVIIRDSSGGRDIARATTDAQGVAIFSTLMESDIRVVIQGQLPNEATYFQPGNDAKGIAMLLSAGTNRMNLLADTDGMIAPDPLTMSALEPGIPIATEGGAIFPTAPVAQPRPTVTAIPAVTLLTSQARPGLASAAAAPAADETAPATTPLMIWLGVALLVVLIGAGVGIIVLGRRWR